MQASAAEPGLIYCTHCAVSAARSCFSIPCTQSFTLTIHEGQSLFACQQSGNRASKWPWVRLCYRKLKAHNLQKSNYLLQLLMCWDFQTRWQNMTIKGREVWNMQIQAVCFELGTLPQVAFSIHRFLHVRSCKKKKKKLQARRSQCCLWRWMMKQCWFLEETLNMCLEVLLVEFIFLSNIHFCASDYRTCPRTHKLNPNLHNLRAVKCLLMWCVSSNNSTNQPLIITYQEEQFCHNCIVLKIAINILTKSNMQTFLSTCLLLAAAGLLLQSGLRWIVGYILGS